jgi:uncharacterized protein involved in exopolysaccharide biosynthesis
MTEAEHKRRTPRDLLRMVFRRWRLFLLSAGLFAMAAMLMAQQALPLKYTGETKFERRSDETNETEATRSESSEVRKLTLEYEITGFQAMLQAAEDEGLTKGLPHGPDGQLTPTGVIARQDLVKLLMQATTLLWDVRSYHVDQITVRFTHSDPDLAERMPDALVRNYINREGEAIKRGLSDRVAFVRKQIEDCDARLSAAVEKRQEFEKKHDNVRPQDSAYVEQQIEQTEREIDRWTLNKKLAEKNLELFGVMSPRPTSGPSSQPVNIFDPRLARLREELEAAKESLQEANLVRHYKSAHPERIKLETKIAALEEKIRQAESQPSTMPLYAGGVSSGGEIMAYQVAQATKEIEEAKKQIADLRVRLNELQGLEGTLTVLRAEHSRYLEKELEIARQRDAYERQEQSLQMALVAETANRRTHLTAIQTAQKQSRPSSPSYKMILAFSVVGGLAFAVGLVLLLQLMDRSITTTEDAARHFDLPVQGVVEEIVPPGLRLHRRLRKWTITPVVAVVVLTALAASTAHVTLWLLFPEVYAEWRQNPAGFVMKNAGAFLGGRPASDSPAPRAASPKPSAPVGREPAPVVEAPASSPATMPAPASRDAEH